MSCTVNNINKIMDVLNNDDESVKYDGLWLLNKILNMSKECKSWE